MTGFASHLMEKYTVSLFSFSQKNANLNNFLCNSCQYYIRYKIIKQPMNLQITIMF